MKIGLRQFLPASVFLLFTLSATGQTLYVPGGAVEASTNVNVGIGTSVPQSVLHVRGSAGSTYIRIEKPNSSTEGGIQFNVGALARFYFWSDNDDNDALKLTAAGLSSENDGLPRMMFPVENTNVYMALSGGNVGVGTTTPDAKLAVKGDIHTREVRVDLNGAVGPDYVFEKDYDLLPLTELETYINQNKHLPEVPSAKEMEANGLNLKEMNLLLLKKVEELTLHLIGQQKEINSLKTEINTLKSR